MTDKARQQKDLGLIKNHCIYFLVTLSHPTSENILWKYVHLGGIFFYVLFIERTRFYNSVQCWAIIFDGWYFALHTLAYYCAGSLHIWLQPQHLSPTIQHQGQMKMKSILCWTSNLANQGKIWSYEEILSHKFKRTLQQSFATDLIEKRTSGTLIIVKSNIDRKKFPTNCWT